MPGDYVCSPAVKKLWFMATSLALKDILGCHVLTNLSMISSILP